MYCSNNHQCVSSPYVVYIYISMIINEYYSNNNNYFNIDIVVIIYVYWMCVIVLTEVCL